MKTTKETFDVTEFATKDEWIVEKYYNGCMHVIGKVPMRNTLHLNNDQLEEIWDLANYECSQPKEVVIDDMEARYQGMIGYMNGNSMVYIPTKDIGVCNDDIYIRKHFNTDEGYCISNNDRHGKDEWVYVRRQVFFSMMRNSRFQR